MALATVTGLVYGWMRYFVHPADEYAVVNHPWQPTLQHLHVLFVPGLVLMLGMFWSAHAAARWRSGARDGRYSGLMLWLCALPMVFSGYALQISVSDAARRVWIFIHVAASLVWCLGYAGHLLAHRLSRRSPTPEAWAAD